MDRRRSEHDDCGPRRPKASAAMSGTDVPGPTRAIAGLVSRPV